MDVLKRVLMPILIVLELGCGAYSFISGLDDLHEYNWLTISQKSKL